MFGPPLQKYLTKTTTYPFSSLYYKELAWAKNVLRVKSTKINTVQNGKKLWEFSKCSSEGLGHDNHLIDILTKRTCLAYMHTRPHMVKWSWSLHGMSFHGSPVTHLTHRKGSVQNIPVFFQNVLESGTNQF